MSDVSPSQVIERFGGFRPLAEKLGRPESTIRNWPETGIPGKWHLRLLRLAREEGIELSEDELSTTSTNTGRAA